MFPEDRITVLYAESDADSGEMLKVLLSFASINVEVVRSSQEAMRRAQADEFDLLLIDNWFPDGSGLDLCVRLRSRMPEIPIVFYSGDAFEHDRMNGLAAGADDYLVKPNASEVAPKVLELVRRRSGAGSFFRPAAPAMAFSHLC